MTRETVVTGMPGHFAKVARVYREVRTTDPGPILYIRDILAGRAGVRAADVGCGAGRYDRLLFEHIPGLDLTCVDASQYMLEQLSGYLAEAGIRNFTTQLSRVEDLALERGSLDAVFTFNAVHHFSFPTFLAKARDALCEDSHLFVYTRTPEQNAGSVWGRFFPRFNDKESRLHTPERMEAWVAETSGLGLVEAKVFRHARKASLDRLLDQARSRHYSTFSLYDEGEFEADCRTFNERVRRQFDDLEAIQWHDENTMLHVAKGQA